MTDSLSETQNQQSKIHDPRSRKRPFSVTLIILLVLIFTTLNFLRVFSAIHNLRFLATLPVRIPFVYLAAMGSVWTVTGIALAAGLFFGRRWSLRLARSSVIIYCVYYWADRLLLVRSDLVAIRWPFSLGLTFILGAFIFGILSRPASKSFLSR